MDHNQDNLTENKSSDHLYLERLAFRPELRKTWLNFFVTNFRVVMLMIILITMWGLYSFFQLPRESNPEVKIPIAVVVTSYPGASPADIEELVTKKLETGISGLKDIDTLTSNSYNSLSSITVEFDAKADLDDSLRKLRDEVKNIQGELPDDANESVVKEISLDDQPIWTFSFTGPFDGFTLRSFADNIQDELEKIPGVREVNISGGDEREFEVAYDPQKLTFYNLSANDANQIIAASNLAVPSGSFEGSKFTYPVRTDARFYDAKKLADLPLFHTDEGAIVYLKDVARVTERAIKHTVYSRTSIAGAKAENSITFSVVKKTGGSVIKIVDQAKSKMDELLGKYPHGLKYDTIIDNSEYIKQDFDQLTHDFFLTLILVSAILFLVVGLKEAFVAGLAVPMVFFVTFGVMDLTGITLNFLSLLSLLLSLGLLVDDAIVVVSATKQYLRSGKFTPEEAVLLVLNDFKVVLTTTTLTTVWAFLPLLSSSGIMGEYLKSIPITVSVTLVASLLIALMINHPLAAVLERIRLTRKLYYLNFALVILGIALCAYVHSILSIILGLILAGAGYLMWKWFRTGGRDKLLENKRLMAQEWDNDELIKAKLKHQGDEKSANLGSRLIHGIINFGRILPIYEKYLKMALADKKSRLKTLAGAIGLLLVAIALPVTGIVKSEFFPATDMDFTYIDIKAPTGTNLDMTDRIVRQVEEKLMVRPEIANFSTVVGQGSTGNSMGSGKSSAHLASITLNLVDKEQRKLKSYELAEDLRQELKKIKGAEISVEAPRGGPPSGSAFEARITGDDLSQLDRIAHDLKPLLTSISGVVDADISLKDSPAEYTFSLDPIRMELYSLNAAYVGSTLRMAISGTEITKVIKDGKETKVIARFDESKLPTLEAVQNIQIINLKKQPVFLKDVAKIELKPSVDTITRIDQKRTVLLSAGVTGKTRPNAVVAEFQEKVARDYKLPSGYEIVYGGENEQNTESVVSILRAMVIAGLLIISTLIIQFNSFKKAAIVLSTIPLALIGVFFGLALARVNLTFPGLIGILALFGIVVKNAIILVDKINLNIRSGIPFFDAIVDAGKSRLEAIFITSICTILGIIPVTLSNETWVAMGSAIIFGLMLSSFLTLFIVPTLYMLMVKAEKNK